MLITKKDFRKTPGTLLFHLSIPKRHFQKLSFAVDPDPEIRCNTAMIIEGTGKICNGFYVVGSESVPVYLLDSPVPILFDAGLTAGAFLYETGIRQILEERVPEYLFLPHSHFDHIGSVNHFKTAWPDFKARGSVRSYEILQKPNAVQLIRDLNGREGNQHD